MNEILTKVCFKCNIEKPITEFYKHPKMILGVVGKCKECNKSDVRKDYYRKVIDVNWVEKERERGREKYHRLNYKEIKPSKEAKRKAQIIYKDRYPEKAKAKNISQRLKPLIKGNHLHHWNYNIEFAKDVIELNPKDHAKIHRFIRYDKTTFMYKDLSGKLLDTKEKHINLINKVLLNF